MQSQIVALGTNLSKANLALQPYIEAGWVPVSLVVHGTTFAALLIREIDEAPAPEAEVSPKKTRSK
jgi:hypothetical protein